MVFRRFQEGIEVNQLAKICLILALPARCILGSCIKIKINLNFYFNTSLWCLKGFYEGLKRGL